MGTYNKATHAHIMVHRDTKMALLKMFPLLKVRTYDDALKVLLAGYNVNPYA